MQVDFYHLTVRPLERVLPRIAERVIEGGGRLLIVAGEADARDRLDKWLWAYAPESFLPHAQADGEADAEQPVLIAADAIAANGAKHIALADGQWRDATLEFDRAFHFFDDESVAAARAAWRALADRPGVERRYWKQGEGGAWEQAA